ncbi:hypothetical protein DXG01_010779 [Tephrocybe rancida]|nr:hypothetical protein DXG01_010779 [Tephrocybe rancida]
MPDTIISSGSQTFESQGSEKLQAAQQRAGDALQKLRESGGDSEAADVLFARFEELKTRHERLRELQGSISTDTQTPGTETSPAKNIDEDSEPEITPQQMQVVQREDGGYECILGPDLKYPLPNDLNVEDGTQLAIGIADEFVKLAMEAVGDYIDDLHDAQTLYIANLNKDLSGQRERIDKLETTKASELAMEVAAQMYLNDALRFLQNTTQIVKLIASEPRSGSLDEGSS